MNEGHNEPRSLDLDDYLARIGYAGDLGPTRKVLEGLHLAHSLHIPFENLDVLLGRPIKLDLESIQGKLVKSRRGGYCFEQNALFAAVLQRVGFAVTLLAARVRNGATRLLPRTHMLLKVEAEGTSWIADVGFGSEGLLLPIPLKPDEVNRQFHWSYRLRREGERWALQGIRQGAWMDIYVFSLEPQYPVDYEVANYYVSTHPDSRFTQTLAVQLATRDTWYLLRNYDFIVKRADGETVRTIESDEELLRVLKETFGLQFPDGTRFPFKTVL
ncbi:MAG: arylamine N-acetyltransferase family protein [Gemmataceae bacterium]